MVSERPEPQFRLPGFDELQRGPQIHRTGKNLISDYPNLSAQTLLTDENGSVWFRNAAAFGVAAAYNRHCLK
jgi:hypothetical protein